MSKLEKEIEAILWEQRRKTILIILAILIPIMTLMYFWYTAEQGRSTEVVGTVVDIGSSSTESGDKQYLIVKLTSGQEVQIEIDELSQHKKNGKIRLMKINPKYFGETKYRVLSYVE